jgi:uncharacterized protein (TIGR02265 family)
MSDGKIKGSIMSGIVRYLRLHRREAQKLLPPHLQHYLDTRILATGWHPEEDYLALMKVLVQLRQEPKVRGISRFEEAAREAATTHFEGPYRSLLRKGDPARTLGNLRALWQLRHDTGEVVVTMEGEKDARVELRGYSLVAPESCDLTQGTFWGMIHHSGAKDIKVSHTRCRSRGDDLCEWRVSWA